MSRMAPNELLFLSPPTLHRGFNGLCTSKEKIIVSGAKARRPLRQAQGGINSTAPCQFAADASA
jgi:hypothetical protein